MKNQEIAKILREIGNYLKTEEVKFKPYAYKKAAITLETLEKDVSQIYKEGGLEALKKIPGVGESIAKKIEEYIKEGKIRYYQKIKKELPVATEELTKVEGMGPKKARKLFEKLGVRNLEDLEKAAKEGKIRNLEGFGKKTEKNILQGIKFLEKSKGRFLLGDILPTAREIKEKLKRRKEVKRVNLAGSLRRMKETIGDVDILVVSKTPQKTMDFFVSLPGVMKVWGKGKTKSSVRTKQGFDMDLRVIPQKSYGAALQYFTGSKEHNIHTRRIAIDKGLKLSEYGVFRGKKQIAGKKEKEVYEAIGLSLIPPEMRLNKGEIEAAQRGELPQVIGYDAIRGDLHCHSKWDGGNNSISEMVKIAQKMGYEYLGISDHTKFLKIEHGLDEKELTQQRKEIDKLNKKFESQSKKFKILQGAETNILKDGRVDINDKALRKLDYAIAGIHSHFKMKEKEMTERIIRTMKNPNINIISHPTGRILKRRDEYKINFNRILRAAKEYNVILEINSFPERLDLNEKNIRKVRNAKVKMVINTDSHHKDQLRFIEFGIGQARRGWATPEDIINTRSLKQLLKFFKNNE